METSELAAKQKRVLDWRAMLPFVQDLTVRKETEDKLAQLSEVLYRTWQKSAGGNGVVDPESEAKIRDLERQLEQLNDEGRIRIVAEQNSKTRSSATR